LDGASQEKKQLSDGFEANKQIIQQLKHQNEQNVKTYPRSISFASPAQPSGLRS